MKIRGFFPLNWFGIRGMVIYPFILFAPKNPDKILEQHEHIHWQQIKTHGFFSFYLNYLKEYLEGRKRGLSHNDAYYAISFEKEAYSHQEKGDYLVTRESTASFRNFS